MKERKFFGDVVCQYYFVNGELKSLAPAVDLYIGPIVAWATVSTKDLFTIS